MHNYKEKKNTFTRDDRTKHTRRDRSLQWWDINDWTNWKNITLGSNHPEKYQLKTNHFFSYRKHNAIYFQINVQRRQTAFHAEQRALLINNIELWNSRPAQIV